MGNCLRLCKKEYQNRSVTEGEAMQIAQSDLEKENEKTEHMMQRITILADDIVKFQREKKPLMAISSKVFELKSLLRLHGTRTMLVNRYNQQVSTFQRARVTRNISNRIADTQKMFAHAGLSVASVDKAVDRGNKAMEDVHKIADAVDEAEIAADVDVSQLNDATVDAFLRDDNVLTEADMQLLSRLTSTAMVQTETTSTPPAMILGLPTAPLPPSQQPQTTTADDDSVILETVKLLPQAHERPPESSLAGMFLQSDSSISTTNRTVPMDVIS